MIEINHGKCTLCEACIAACPFAALMRQGNRIVVLESCRLCKICVKRCPEGAIFVAGEGGAARLKGSLAGSNGCGRVDRRGLHLTSPLSWWVKVESSLTSSAALLRGGGERNRSGLPLRLWSTG